MDTLIPWAGIYTGAGSILTMPIEEWSDKQSTRRNTEYYLAFSQRPPVQGLALFLASTLARVP